MSEVNKLRRTTPTNGTVGRFVSYAPESKALRADRRRHASSFLFKGRGGVGGNHFIRSCGLANRFVKAIQETDITIRHPLTKHALFWDFYVRQNGRLLQTFRDNLLKPHAAQMSLQSMTQQKKVHPYYKFHDFYHL